MPSMKKPFAGRSGDGEDGFEPLPAIVYKRAVGQRVRALREEAGLTQAALGKRVGLGGTAISNIEVGLQTIRPELYETFARELGADGVEFGEFLLLHYDPWLYGMIYGKRAVKALLARLRPRGSDTRKED